MSRRPDELLVADIREAVEKVLLYTAGMGEVEFMGHGMAVDAVIRNVEVMGEAASNISDDYAKAHANVPFRKMAALRNRLIHGYFKINLPILWQIVKEDIPFLKIELSKM